MSEYKNLREPAMKLAHTVELYHTLLAERWLAIGQSTGSITCGVRCFLELSKLLGDLEIPIWYQQLF